jgi:hypothetical protein
MRYEVLCDGELHGEYTQLDHALSAARGLFGQWEFLTIDEPTTVEIRRILNPIGE